MEGLKPDTGGLFSPDEVLPTVFVLDLDKLNRQGIQGLIVDLDNTLVPWRAARPSPEARRWIQRVRSAGLKVCIVSNGGSRRVAAFAGELNIPSVGGAGKPARGGFLKALALLGTEPRATAVIGDQIFTDVLGGNRLGLYTILVNPVSAREFIGTKLLRLLERWVLRRQ